MNRTEELRHLLSRLSELSSEADEVERQYMADHLSAILMPGATLHVCHDDHCTLCDGRGYTFRFTPDSNEHTPKGYLKACTGCRPNWSDFTVWALNKYGQRATELSLGFRDNRIHHIEEGDHRWCPELVEARNPPDAAYTIGPLEVEGEPPRVGVLVWVPGDLGGLTDTRAAHAEVPSEYLEAAIEAWYSTSPITRHPCVCGSSRHWVGAHRHWTCRQGCSPVVRSPLMPDGATMAAWIDLIESS